MKDELQSKLVEILTAMQTVAGQAKDFTLSQLPDIAQSYVMYGRVMTSLGIVASLLAAVAVCILFRKIAQLHREDSLNPVSFFGGIFLAMFCLFGTAWAWFNLKAAALVWFAPKVWLLKEIAGLIK